MDVQTEVRPARRAIADDLSPCRTIVLVGLMGAGKTKIGRRLAARLNLPFFDSDEEIESADGERRVITRLLQGPVHVLSTGGGAFMDPATRRIIAARGVSVWLRAGLDVLFARVSRRSNRPLLKTPNPKAVLAELIERRHPIYAEADVTVDSGEGPPDATASRVIAALTDYERTFLPAAEGGDE
jgi:shikimate kinase